MKIYNCAARWSLFGVGSFAALAACGEVVAFKDADKIKSWDAWTYNKGLDTRHETPSVTWKKLCKLDCGLEPFGVLETRPASDIRGSKWSIGCETMDRDYADWNAYKHLLEPLGAKHGRLFSGWAKTEQEKGRYDFTWLDPQVREMSAMGVKPWICLSHGNPVYGSDFRLGMRVKQVTDKPEAFEAWLRYCTACVEHQFSDQATSGRFDGEYLQVGWTDICDTPYPEAVSAIRELGEELYNTKRK